MSFIIVHLLQTINDDDLERIALSLKVLADRSPLMINILTEECRKSLAAMLAAKHEEELENQKVNMLICEIDLHESCRIRTLIKFSI